MAIMKEGNVKWVDGLRGIASMLVVVKHITCAWFPYLLSPAPAEGEAPVLLELPFFRVFIQGRIGVAIFSFVTGYVCSLKPIKNFKSDNHNSAFASISKSALRRLPRLVLPVTIIVTLSCLATQLGAFEVANHCDGGGLPLTSPDMRDNFIDAIISLFQDLLRVWTHGASEYGSELWTMAPILKGAFWVYMFLVTTAHVQQKWRMALAMGLCLFRWAANDPFFGMQFFFGVLMADLQNLQSDLDSASPIAIFLTEKSRLRGVIAAALLTSGMYIASLPDADFAWTNWSQGLVDFLLTILPLDPDLPRFSSALGLDLIVLGLHLSPTARNVLSNRFFLWFGRMSFAVYLLHNQILRSILCWMVYGFAIPEPIQDPVTGEWVPGPLLEFTGPLRLFCVLPIYFALTYGSAHLWTTYVDAWCGRMTERMVSKIKEDGGEKPGPPLLPVTVRA